jgi:hypothetical protein
MTDFDNLYKQRKAHLAAQKVFQAEVLANPSPKRAASWAKTPESERAEKAILDYYGEKKVRLERNLPYLAPEGETDPRRLKTFDQMGYGWTLRILDTENPFLAPRLTKNAKEALKIKKRAQDRAAYQGLPQEELDRMVQEDNEYADYILWGDSVRFYGQHEHIIRQFMLLKWPGHPLRDLALELWGVPQVDDTGTITINPLRPGHQTKVGWVIAEPAVFGDPIFFPEFTQLLSENGGIVVDISDHRYRVTIDNVDLDIWYEDPSDIEVKFEPTTDPLTETVEPNVYNWDDGVHLGIPGDGVQFFGEGRFQQDAKSAVYKGQKCYTLLTGDPLGHDMTWTLMFNTDDEGKPCRLWLETSGT